MAGVAEQRIVVPYAPRPLQKVLHEALQSHRFAVAICHRRFGKTVLAINHLQKCALKHTRTSPPPKFAYVMPYLKQGKDVVWKYIQEFSSPIPYVEYNATDYSVTYPNGAYLRVYGADNEASLRGGYFDGVVMDEYGDMSDTVWPQVIRPMLSDYKGWAFFIGTPQGKNQFYEIAQIAQTTPGWFFAAYKASETNVIDGAELADARITMTEDTYRQEYECSFEASVKGAVYGRELQAAREGGRIARVPFEPRLPVHTDWDLGMRDFTAIWFSQTELGGAVRVIGYYENQGESLAHYAGILDECARVYGYRYGTHHLPHDAAVKEMNGNTRIETLWQSGVRNTQIGKPYGVEEGINAARLLFPKCWFDADKCAKGLDRLGKYRWRWNESIKAFAADPVHDDASHAADAFRYLAMRHRTPTVERKANEMRRDIDPDDWRYGKNRQQRTGTAGPRGGW